MSGAVTAAETALRDELGFYALAGGPPSAAALGREMARAEELGIGQAFLSERLGVKEAAATCGAMATLSSRIGIATAATNPHTRHPLTLAGFASTVQGMAGGRFSLGLARGEANRWREIGLGPVTGAQVEDLVGLLRRLWRGERVLEHDGPAGRFPALDLGLAEPVEIPVLWTTLGFERSLQLTGRVFDGVVLHTFLSDEALARCVRTVKEAAAAAGRDPAAVAVWSVVATVGDHLPEVLRLKKLVGRLASYLQFYGDLLVEVNGWDPAALARFRADPFVAEFEGLFDARASDAELAHLAELLPAEWLAAAATGDSASCVSYLRRQLDLGADGVILHGASPDELAPILAAYHLPSPADRSHT